MNFALEWRKRRKDVAKLPAIKMVEKATSDLIKEPDWAINMDICDLVNSDLRQAQDVIKTVKKRLLHKSPMVRYLALMLLETMVKNCGGHVHHQVVEYEVLHEMVNIATKKDDMLARDKILMLLDAWQEAFGGPQGQYPQFFWAYSQLKGSGIEFPPRSENAAPIFTPPITNPTPRNPSQLENSPSLRLDEVLAFEEEILSLSDFQSIREVMELLKDMLKAINKNDREALHDEVLADLVKRCCSNKEKIMDLINSTRNEELLFLALPLNDDLQDLISKYDALVTGQPIPSEEPKLLPATNGVSRKISEKIEDDDDDDENDGFTQLARRNSNVQRTSSNTQPSRENGSIEPSASWSTSSGETSIATLSPSSSVSTAMVGQGGPDMVCRLSSLSIGQLPQVPRFTANRSTSVLPISHSSTPSSSVSSYNSSNMLGSLAMPPAPNHLDFSRSQHSVPALPVQSTTHPYNPYPRPINEGYFPYDEFATPWARHSHPQASYQVQQQDPANLSSYPPPPWETSSSHEGDDFLPCVHIENEPKTSHPLQLHSLVNPRDVATDTRTARAADIPSIQMSKNQQDAQKDGVVNQTADTSSRMQQYRSQVWMEGCDPSRSQSEAVIAHTNF